METCLYIHFVVLKDYKVYVHIEIPKVPCFVCMPNCYGIGGKYFKQVFLDAHIK